MRPQEDVCPKARKKLNLVCAVSSSKFRDYLLYSQNKKEQIELEKLKRKEEAQRKREKAKLEKEEAKKRKLEATGRKKGRGKREESSSESECEVPELSEDEGADWNRAPTSSEPESEDDVRIKNPKKVNVKDYVIVKYAGQHFPGLVLRLVGNRYEVKAMERSGLKHWRWPERDDVLLYNHQEILKTISPPKQINKRGAFLCPEMDRFSNFV